MKRHVVEVATISKTNRQIQTRSTKRSQERDYSETVKYR
jgi:hypothetical protein